jgi:hypothetical protein
LKTLNGLAATAIPAHLQPPQIEQMPAELKARPQWVVWKYGVRDGKPTKVPYQSRHPDRKAQTNAPSTWSSFEEAWATYCQGDVNGIGFVFSADDPYFGVDVDHCLKDGEVQAWAIPILAQLQATYGEISPSGNGIKFVGTGKLPGATGTKRLGLGPDGTGALEIYDHKRFFTLTGNLYGDATDITELQPAAESLYRFAQERPEKKKTAQSRKSSSSSAPTGNEPHDDQEILRVANYSAEFRSLWAGQHNFGSPSEADLSLANRLAFYCGSRQEDQVKRLFLQSELGQRDKAKERSDYLDRTISTAYQGRTQYFEWNPPQNGNGKKATPSSNGDVCHPPQCESTGQADNRPAVEVSMERHLNVEAAIKALGRDPELFLRGDSLGIVIEEPSSLASLPGGVELANAQGSTRFMPLSESGVGCRLTRNATFFEWRKDRNGELVAWNVHPPSWLIKAVATQGYWPGLRPLLGIAQCPYVRPDGSIPSLGYDRLTGSVYKPSVVIPEIPQQPTRRDAWKAADNLNHLVHQFPFANGYDWSVWLAALLTGIQRPIIQGPIPGFAFNGNRAGCGKGLLIDVAGLIVWGHQVPTRSYPSDPSEAAKVKLSLALAATPAVHLDNLREGGLYGSSELDSALTSTVISDRILGQSRDSGPVPLRPLWTLSGNNISPAKDAYRRWLPCNLSTELENPHERPDFEVVNLRAYVADHRGELLRDALVILRAHALAGRPSNGWARLGSFEEWDEVVRGAVWFATGNDCLQTQREAAAESPDHLDKLALLQGWRDLDVNGGGLTVDEVLRTVDARLHSTLYAALMRMSKDNKMPSSRTLGYHLRAIKGQNVGGMRFDKAGQNRDSIVLWKVTRVHSPHAGDAGDAGDVGNSPA